MSMLMLKLHWHGFLINCESGGVFYMEIDGRASRTFDKMKEERVFKCF